MNTHHMRTDWLWVIVAAFFLTACCQMSQFKDVRNTALQYEKQGDFQKALREFHSAKSICPNEKKVDADIRRVSGKIEAHQYYLEGQQAVYKRQTSLACDYYLKAYELWPGHPRLAAKVKRCRKDRPGASTASVRKQATVSKTGPSVIHTVRSGESLSGIITNYYGEYKRLISAIEEYNKIKGGLQVGDKIKLPSMSVPDEGVLRPKRQPQASKAVASRPSSAARPAASTPSSPRQPAAAPQSSPRPQSSPKTDTCKTFLDQAHNQYRARHYPQALELFESADACSEECRECRKYIFYIEGLLMGQKGLISEAVDQLDDALEYDPNDHFRPSNRTVQALKEKLDGKQFETFRADFSATLTQYKKVRQYENARKMFNAKNYTGVLKWLDDSSSNGIREINALQKIRRRAEECSQCHEYEMSVKQRLYREAISHDQAERPMQAFIAWDTLNAIDAVFKDVRQKRNDAKTILKKLLPLM